MNGNDRSGYYVNYGKVARFDKTLLLYSFFATQKAYLLRINRTNSLVGPGA